MQTQTQFNTELDNRPDYAIENQNTEVMEETTTHSDEYDNENNDSNGFDLDSFFEKGFEVPEVNSHRESKQLLPTEGHFRVFKNNGRMYPSREFVDFLKEYKVHLVGTQMEVPVDLEYAYREDNTFGIDVIDMRELLKNDNAKFVGFGFTPRNEPKLDVYRSTKYKADDTAKSSIFDQGNANERLVKVLEGVYGESIWLDEEGNEKEYIELTVRIDKEVPEPQNGKFMLLKDAIHKGKLKQKPVYRKNTRIFAIEIVG